MFVDRATSADWPAIERWRVAHFRKLRERSPQVLFDAPMRGFDDALWLVVRSRVGAPPIAAAGFLDVGRQRQVYDLYRAPGTAGIRAVRALTRSLLANADELGLTVLSDTDAANVEFIAQLREYGFEPTWVGFQRAPIAQKEALRA